MQGSHSDGSWESEAPTLIDFSEGPTAEAPPSRGDDLLTGDGTSCSTESSEKALQSYTQLLLAGRKKVSTSYHLILVLSVLLQMSEYTVNDLISGAGYEYS